MKKRKRCTSVLLFVCMAMLLVPPCLYSQGTQQSARLFKAEELEQILAPIALYPDSLLTQILMASTYPLEIVQADRWAKQNKSLKGDALAKALETQAWDPSVKSLVNFPQVLGMMGEKLDWTQKVGDAFLAQQKDVMGTIQKLRAKAQASGNLKTTKEQVVKVDKEVIVIEPASPQVVYVPAYDPSVVYGSWAYPAYPPYPVYPPGYVAGTAALSFMTGAVVGAAWGYAWGNANWRGGDVNVNVNQNANINNNINRSKYQQQYQGQGKAGQGQWQHDSSHRGGVAYKDQGTAQKYNKGASGDRSRDAYKGRSGQGGAGVSTQPAGAGGRQGTTDRGGSRPSPSTMERGGNQGAFGGMEKGSTARMESSRGQSSRQSTPSQSVQRGGGGGGGGGGGRSGGGGGGRSGGGGGGRGGGGRR